MTIWRVEEIKTLAEAERLKTDEIARLQDGGERDLANLLARCRKKSRCNLTECPVCEYRKERVATRIAGATTTKSVIGGMDANIYVTGVNIVGKRRPLSETKVRFLATSMREIGQQTPITVRMVKKKVVLVAGLHRLAAAKLLGWDTIRCSYMVGDKIDARMWEISENLHRADLRVLDRAESIEEWRTLILEKAKGGQVLPPGGRQPKDAGIKKTAKELGLTREEIRRSKTIAGISPKAKEAARKYKLDNSQRALLEIARQPTPSAQLKAIEEIVERKRIEQTRYSSEAEKMATAEIATLKANLAKNVGTLESLEAKIASQRKHLRKLKEAPAAGYADITASVRSPLAAVTDDHATSEINSSLDWQDPETLFAAMRAAWAETDLAGAWADTPKEVRERFIAEVLM